MRTYHIHAYKMKLSFQYHYKRNIINIPIHFKFTYMGASRQGKYAPAVCNSCGVFCHRSLFKLNSNTHLNVHFVLMAVWRCGLWTVKARPIKRECDLWCQLIDGLIWLFDLPVLTKWFFYIYNAKVEEKILQMSWYNTYFCNNNYTVVII